MSSGRSLSSFPLPENSKRKVLVGCSGSVAAVKVPKLVQLLEAAGFSVAVVTTNNATKFFRTEDIAESVPIFTDDEEWKMWQKMMDPVLHIELRRWADILVVAPMDANTLAKAASGICDNLLTCVMRAWDCKKPLLFCPAMNTYMWDHPITAPQIDLLKSWGYTEIPCIKKKLACGDEGLGAMAEVEMILAAVKSSLTDEVKSGTER
ncbi:Phosphopantothenoylcysteine decarboxylase [Holothuria leucospilota]|uniref:Phosphopantothenoylcysteine decarboxylase n=1 Tax=Holothuria leucospilota TaxID=206669 RepID=A0A9Q1BMC9_HOLLE|nr:Phosphopantothenoylcysteine decarboxylase [Holothuria leucospilota]